MSKRQTNWLKTSIGIVAAGLICFYSFLFLANVPSKTHAQSDARVASTASPIVVPLAADLANLDVSDGQVVIIADASGGTMLIYDASAVDAVDGSTVFNGPNSIGRFKAMSVSGGVLDSAMSDVSTNAVTNAAIKAYVDSAVSGGTIDSAMSDVSNNAVSNAVIKAYVDAAVSGGTIDTAMSASSENAVQNKVIKAYVDAIGGATIDTAMSDVSTNAVQNKIIKAYVDAAVSGGTIDSAMSDVSTNAVRNNVIKAYVDATVAGGTIDTEMSGASNNAVRNSVIKDYVDDRTPVQTTDWIVTSTAELTTALSEADTQGYGTIWIQGEVTIPEGSTTVDGAVSIRGLGPGASLVKDGNAAGGISIGDLSFTPFNNGYGTHEGTFLSEDLAAHRNYFVAPGLTAAAGDWVLFISDTDITDGPWHDTSSPGHPAEMHQIRRTYTDGADTVFVINGFTADAFSTRDGPDFTASGATLTSTSHGLVADQPVHVTSTGTLPGNLAEDTVYYARDIAANTFGLAATVGGAAITTSSAGTGTHTVEFRPRVVEVPMKIAPNSNASHVVIDNIEFKSVNTPALENIFNFYCIDTLEITNCKWERIGTQAGPSYTTINFCSNVNIHDNYVYSVNDIDGSAYWIVASIVNGLKVSNNFGQEVRHFFTTGGDTFTIGAVTHRIGTPLRCLISDNVVFSSQNTSHSGLPAFDTHAEGWGITFAGNLCVTTGAQGSGHAFSIRSRYCNIIGNAVYSDGSAGGALIQAPNCTVRGNTFYNCLYGVQTSKEAGTGAVDQGWDNLVCDSNTFLNNGASSARAVMVAAGGDYHIFSNNTVRNSDGWVFRCTEGDNIRFVGNQVFDTGTGGAGGMLAFEGTGGNAVDNAVVARNLFSGYRTTAGSPSLAVVHFEGDGSGNEVIDNVFHDCKANALVEFEGGTGHRVAGNDMPKDLNNYSIDLGSTATTAVTILGNTMDGFGLLELGLTGTYGTTVDSMFEESNWTY